MQLEIAIGPVPPRVRVTVSEASIVVYSGTSDDPVDLPSLVAGAYPYLPAPVDGEE